MTGGSSLGCLIHAMSVCPVSCAPVSDIRRSRATQRGGGGHLTLSHTLLASSGIIRFRNLTRLLLKPAIPCLMRKEKHLDLRDGVHCFPWGAPVVSQSHYFVSQIITEGCYNCVHGPSISSSPCCRPGPRQPTVPQTKAGARVLSWTFPRIYGAKVHLPVLCPSSQLTDPWLLRGDKGLKHGCNESNTAMVHHLGRSTSLQRYCVVDC
ncbi:CYFA0S12e01244g1_1 [Cyberlindnera fabianii]|uniref:CYFA0S12e01244g1_1 n=1 Tax=Cyberlindnera fabianii TaxID=36022 RepID=A0A061B261_CYBFA|nr:CYFA0S12e01244g1_1 [Cyberlindnera fabianii]